MLNADGTISSVTLGTFLYSNDTATSCVSLLKYNSSGVAQWAAGSDMPYVNEYDVGVTTRRVVGHGNVAAYRSMPIHKDPLGRKPDRLKRT